MFSVIASTSDILSALKFVVTARKKVTPILIFQCSDNSFGITDAKYHKKGKDVAFQGYWDEGVEFELDGLKFKKLIGTYPDDVDLVLMVSESCVEIRYKASTVRVPRLDSSSKKKTKRKPLPHKGKPKEKEKPLGQSCLFDDTWGFSARVPMPKEAYLKRHYDSDQ